MIRIVKSVVIGTEDTEIISSLSVLLMKYECSIIIEKSTIKSILKLLAIDIDFLIVDIGQPNQTTFDLIDIVRLIRPKLPIISLSVDNSVETLRELANAGVYYCAFKPIQLNEIETVIKAILESETETNSDLLKDKITKQSRGN